LLHTAVITRLKGDKNLASRMCQLWNI